MGTQLTAKQVGQLAFLELIPQDKLSNKQAKQLEHLTQKAAAASALKPEEVPKKRDYASSRPSTSALPDNVKKLNTPKLTPPALCKDQGKEGKDGEWIYPADKTLVCVDCGAGFDFSGAEQAWYAQRGMYTPARCDACKEAKKARFDAKVPKAGAAKSDRCFNCGANGHSAKECTQPQVAADSRACYICGSSAHLSRNCPEAKVKKGNKGCFTCGRTDHMSGSCPQKPTPICFNCGSEGHPMRECSKPLRTEGACFAFAKGQCFRKKCTFTH
jgi:hypothetical protein